jgi:hypothetical protein
MSLIANRLTGRSTILMTVLASALILCVAVPAAFAVSPEAQRVIDEMQDGKHPENINYSFLEIGYDDMSNVLHFAVTDGQHFKDTANLFFRVPVADISDVTVVSNADKTNQEGEIKNIGNDMAPNETGFARVPQGCSVKLTAKTPAFGWMDLKEGDIQNGKLVKDPTEDDLESIKSVLIGFYDCPHARKLQHAFHELHKQVKKGG